MAGALAIVPESNNFNLDFPSPFSSSLSSLSLCAMSADRRGPSAAGGGGGGGGGSGGGDSASANWPLLKRCLFCSAALVGRCKRCALCKKAFFCSIEHFDRAWPAHRAACYATCDREDAQRRASGLVLFRQAFDIEASVRAWFAAQRAEAEAEAAEAAAAEAAAERARIKGLPDASLRRELSVRDVSQPGQHRRQERARLRRRERPHGCVCRNPLARRPRGRRDLVTRLPPVHLRVAAPMP